MTNNRAIQPDEQRGISLPGQPSRLLARGRQYVGGRQYVDRTSRSLIDLGALGGRSSEATDINDRGQVVGWAESEEGDRTAFLYGHDTMLDLGSIGGWPTEARAINSRGQVLVTEIDKWGLIWEDGQMRELELPQTIDLSIVVEWNDGHSHSIERSAMDDEYVACVATDMNDHGQIVGHFEALFIEIYDEILGDVRCGFLWDRGAVILLDDFVPRAINNAGQIIGSDAGWRSREHLSIRMPACDPAQTARRARGGRISGARAINDRGQIVGTTYADSAYFPSATLWEAGREKALGVLDGAQWSVATSINNRGQVVGWSGDATDGREDQEWNWVCPFLWEDGRMTTLPAVVSEGVDFEAALWFGSAWSFDLPLRINDSGQVAGTLETEQLDRHAFLLA